MIPAEQVLINFDEYPEWEDYNPDASRKVTPQDDDTIVPDR